MGSAPILDSGASHHMTGDRDLLHNVMQCEALKVQLADGRWTETSTCGTIELSVRTNEDDQASNQIFTLLEVYIIVGFAHTLLSVGKLTEQGHAVIFRGDKCTVMHPDGVTVALLGNRNRGIYRVAQPSHEEVCMHAFYGASRRPDFSLLHWHRTLGHVHVQAIRDMIKHGSTRGLTVTNPNQHIQCDECVLAKQARTNIPREITGTSARPDNVCHVGLSV